MKKFLFFCMICLISITTEAQKKISLHQAIELGLQNRYDVKANKKSIDLAENAVSQQKKTWVPTIEAKGSVQYNTQLRSTPIPPGFFGMEEGGLIALGAKNSTAIGISLNQPLFQPGINTRIKESKTQLSIQKERFHEKEINVKNEIATAYLSVLLKKLQFKIAKKEEERYKTYQALAQGKYNDGVLIKNNYLRTQLDYKNAHVKTITNKQNYRLSLSLLKYVMNLPDSTTVELTDTLGGVLQSNKTSSVKGALVNRTEIKQLILTQQLDSLKIKTVRQNAIPTVSLYGYYGQLYQNNNFRYADSKWWAPESYIGIRFSIPITSNFVNHNKIQHAKLEQDQIDYQLKQLSSTIRYQIQKARKDLENADKNMRTAKENYSLAQIIYSNQKKQFAIGVFNYEDLLNTEKSLHQAETQYIQSVYSYLADKIAYQKAVGAW